MKEFKKWLKEKYDIDFRESVVSHKSIHNSFGIEDLFEAWQESVKQKQKQVQWLLDELRGLQKKYNLLKERKRRE